MGFRRRRHGGFTVAEVAMAVIVLAMAITTSLTAMQRAFLSLDTARNLEIAGHILQCEMEKERLLEWAVVNDPLYQPALDSSFARNPAVGGRFTLSRSLVPLEGRSGKMVQVVLTVRWRGYDGRTLSRSYTSYFGEGGLREYFHGFTLVEVMVATLLSGVVLAGVLAANLQIVRSGVRITQYAEMSVQSRRGLERLGSDLRNASGIKWNSASDLTLTLPAADGATTVVTYAWTSATQSLFRVPGADSTVTTGREVLIRGVPPFADGGAGVAFSRYDRAGNAATTDAATKRVQVVVNLVRQSQTMAVASHTAVSASFVLRNKPTS